ncbi:MAG: PilZ domain-containing protein [Candidatus Omnitrophica bacterium]|nr:PilZ domain-containing protein [Candidatus Omnitrophota bacterium]
MVLGIEKIKKLFIKDKRRSERLILPVTIDYSLKNPPTESSWTGPITTDDIGGGGLRFNAATKFKKGALLNLRIHLPHRVDPMYVQSEVVWYAKSGEDEKTPYFIGVEFRKMKADDRREYVNFICDKILTNYLTSEGLIK